MSVDEILLLGRVAFLCALYLFLAMLALLLRRELKVRAARSDERAPGDFLVIEPYDTGLETGERIPLLAVTSIGRDGDNDIVLDDGFASSRHARLLWNHSGWVLEDLGSTNGTFLNGHGVQRPAAVKAGDILEFGRVKVKLVPL